MQSKLLSLFNKDHHLVLLYLKLQRHYLKFFNRS